MAAHQGGGGAVQEVEAHPLVGEILTFAINEMFDILPGYRLKSRSLTGSGPGVSIPQRKPAHGSQVLNPEPIVPSIDAKDHVWTMALRVLSSEVVPTILQIRLNA